eukprot:Colp12_sorted_trinity150504_noHs@13061
MFMRYQWTTDKIPFVVNGDLQYIEGRGLKSESLHGFITSTNSLYSEWGIKGEPKARDDGTWKGHTLHHFEVKALRDRLNRIHSHEEKTPSRQLRLFGDFRILFQHARKMAAQQGLVLYLQMLLCFVMFLRRSEVANLHIRDLHFPVDDGNSESTDVQPAVDEYGIPDFIVIALRNTKMEKKKKGVPVMVHRNHSTHALAWFFCPVSLLIFYLVLNEDLVDRAMTGEDVPLFPHMRRSDALFFKSPLECFSWPLYPMSKEEVSAHMDSAFKTAKFEGTSSHTFRRTATAWAISCKIAETLVKFSGRWSGDKFYDYVGSLTVVMHAKNISSAEIKKIWSFPEGGITAPEHGPIWDTVYTG